MDLGGIDLGGWGVVAWVVVGLVAVRVLYVLIRRRVRRRIRMAVIGAGLSVVAAGTAASLSAGDFIGVAADKVPRCEQVAQEPEPVGLASLGQAPARGICWLGDLLG